MWKQIKNRFDHAQQFRLRVKLNCASITHLHLKDFFFLQKPELWTQIIFRQYIRSYTYANLSCVVLNCVVIYICLHDSRSLSSLQQLKLSSKLILNILTNWARERKTKQQLQQKNYSVNTERICSFILLISFFQFFLRLRFEIYSHFLYALLR